MSPAIILLCMAGYLALLLVISRISGRRGDNETFFTGRRRSPWWVVSFGMIGASLSGVTFISVPGWVQTSSMAYMQMVIGYIFGYIAVAGLLLPLYYRSRETTIYGYLEGRYGSSGRWTGAGLFVLSRWVGSSLRLYLVAAVLQGLVFDALGLPFGVTVAFTLGLIWLYTRRGGIRTVLFTDFLQTAAMLAALGLSLYYLADALELGRPAAAWIADQPEARWLFPDASDGRNLFKQLLGGAFISLTMTGLDQDMMQKNLTCRSLRQSQLNMVALSLVLVPVNLAFLSLGVLLNQYARVHGLEAAGDQLFAAVAMHPGMPGVVAALFVLGLTAAAYSSADSALTSLTTSVSVDILRVERLDEAVATRLRHRVHLGLTVAVALLILVIRPFAGGTIISTLLTAAGYTYGPLLGLYGFGLLSKRERPANAWVVPAAAIASPLMTYLVSRWSINLIGYTFGYELILLNGLIMSALLWMGSREEQLP